MAPSHAYQQLVEAFSRQDFTGIADIISKCPPNISAAPALTMLGSRDPYYAMCGIDGIAGAYLHGYNYGYSEVFAKLSLGQALHFQDEGLYSSHNDLQYYVGNGWYYLLKNYNNTGRTGDAEELFGSFSRVYDKALYQPHFAAGLLEMADIYFKTDRIDMAKLILDQIAAVEIPPASAILHDHLHKKLLQQSFDTAGMRTDMDKQLSDAESTARKNMADTFGSLLNGSFFKEDPVLNGFYQELKNLAGNTPAGNAEEFDNATKMFGEMHAYMKTIGGNEDTHHLNELRVRLHAAQKIFHSGDAFSEPHLRETIVLLRELQKDYRAIHDESDTNDVLWSLYICYKRTHQYKIAAEVLEELKARLEQRRKSLADIRERAGVFSVYPFLFPALVEMHFESNETKKMFAAIEDSKARYLADKAILQTGEEYNGFQGGDAESLVSLLAINNAHYLSLFTDDDWCYSVLITNNGNCIAEKINITRQQVKGWIYKGFSNPQSWDNPRSGFFATKADLPGGLTAFIKPIEIAMKQGWVKQGEHIVYSPDDELFLFPLLYAKMADGEFLPKKFSVSKIHSSFQLKQLLRKPLYRNRKMHCISSIAQGDDAIPGKAAGFREVEFFLHPYSVQALEPTKHGVLTKLGQNSLYHFTTHGVFPEKEYPEDTRKQNPYYNSGLLLKAGEQLSSLDSENNYCYTEHLLSPEHIIAANPDITGSHISVQACVSGYAKEGAGGDALGLEWAFFSQGAQSMISANWNIDVHISNSFFKNFYKNYFVEKQTLAVAHRNTVLEMMKSNPEVSYWGGLSLSGDFR